MSFKNFGSELNGNNFDRILNQLSELIEIDQRNGYNHTSEAPLSFENEIPFEDRQNELESRKLSQELSKEDFRFDQSNSKHQEEEAQMSHEQFSNLISQIYTDQQMQRKKINQMFFRELSQLLISKSKERKQQKFKINHESQRIINQKIQNGEYQPIQQRAFQIQQDKKSKLEMAQRVKNDKEKQRCLKLENQYTFRPQIMSEAASYQTRNVEQFLSEVDYWIKKKNHNLLVNQQIKMKKEIENVTFKPQVNPNSERILQKVSMVIDNCQSTDVNTSMEERIQRRVVIKQQNEKKILEEELKKTPFKPQLNLNSVKINEKVNSFYFDEQHQSSGKSDPFARLSASNNPKHLNFVSQQQKKNDFKNDWSNKALNNVLNTSYGKQSAQNLTKHDEIKKKKSQVRINEKGSNQSSFRKRFSPWRKSSPEGSWRQKSESPMLQSNEIRYNPNLKFIVDLISKKA